MIIVKIELSFLLVQHCVAVAIGRRDSKVTPTPLTFSELPVHDLLDKLPPPAPPTTNHEDLLQFWEQFSVKKESPIAPDIS